MSASPGSPVAPLWLRALQGLALGQLAACAAIPLRVTLPVPLPVSPWQLIPLLGAALMCGPRWCQRLMVGGSAALALLFALVVATPVGPAWHQSFVRNDGLAPADVIVVLSAGSTLNQFSPSSLDRWLYGVQLLRQGYAPQIVFTGEPGHKPDQFPSLALEAMRRLDLPTDAVVPFEVAPGETQISTHMEAVSVAHLAPRYGWHSLLLVTSPFHTRRAAMTFEKVGLHVRMVPCPATGIESPSHARGTVRVTMFGLAMGEAMVTLGARWRGWI